MQTDDKKGQGHALPKAQLTAGDATFLKDLGDMVRSRTMFFFPFYGAFLTFLFAKTQYIQDANLIIQVESLITFLGGVSYAYMVARLISRVEEARFIMGLRTTLENKEDFLFSAEEKAAISAVLSSLGPSHSYEKKHFKWSMYILWITTGTVLMDIFLKRPETTAISFVACYVFNSHCDR